MISVKPIGSKEEQEKLCLLCSLAYDVEAMAYGAYDEDKFIGITQFKIKGDSGYITGDSFLDGLYNFEARFIMGRAVMNFIDICGLTNMYYDINDEKFARTLGFKPDKNNRMYVNLKGFFEHPCLKKNT